MARTRTTVIRPAETADGKAVATIYNHYITGTVSTFEEKPIDVIEARRRIEEVRIASLPWLVAQDGESVVGYAYAGAWRTRPSYRFSTEVSIYVAAGSAGRGIGSALYGRLLPLLEERGVHVVLGGIALPNPGSIALHEKFGFYKVAHLREVGFKFGRWIDVGYWQLILNG